MIERDFIKRLIQQFTQVLAEILFHKKNKDWQKAQMVIDVAGKQLLGLNPDLRDNLDAQTLIEMFSYNGETDHEKCLTLAMLLSEQANVSKNSGEDDQRLFRSLKKSLLLFETAFKNKELIKKNSVQSAHYICEELQQFDLDIKALLKIHYIYLHTGAWDKAEDVVFLLQQKGFGEIKQLALDFYQSLLEKDDIFLKKANLPRQEIIDGIKHFQKL